MTKILANRFVGLLLVTIMLVILPGRDANADCPDNPWEDQIVNTHQVDQMMYTRYYYLTVGQTYSWEIKGLEPIYAYPMMRVFGSVANSGSYLESVQDLARDRMSGEGYASKITGFTAPTTGWYLVVVHAYQTGHGGIGQLWFNGGLSDSNLFFGGVMKYTCRLNPGEKIHTMHEPNGADRHQLLVVGRPNEPALYFGSAYSGKRTLAYEHSGPSIPSYTTTYTASQISNSGLMSQVWNDATNDSDNDRVGLLLERRMGTCPNKSTSSPDHRTTGTVHAPYVAPPRRQFGVSISWGR
jgi:hypothetical protein